MQGEQLNFNKQASIDPQRYVNQPSFTKHLQALGAGQRGEMEYERLNRHESIDN